MPIKHGSKVMLHYVLKADEQILEDTRNEGPFEFEIGKQMVLPKFEKEIMGLSKGDKKTISVSPAEAYETFCSEQEQEMACYIYDEKGDLKKAQLKPNQPGAEINESSLILDSTHPLQGKTLIFEVEVLDVTE